MDLTPKEESLVSLYWSEEVRLRKDTTMEKTEIMEIVDVDCYQRTPISSRGTTVKSAISVEQHNEERDLNLAIRASLKSHNAKNFIDLAEEYHYVDDDDDDDVDGLNRILGFYPGTNSSAKQRHVFGCSTKEKGQSSNSKTYPEFICDICAEPRSGEESFLIKGCVHSYCRDCMVKYVASKLQDNITNVSCPVPDCKGLLEPEYCRSILPEEVFDRWCTALCETLILGSEKFYCPYKDCSAMLIDDGGQVIAESECPYCWRLFCARCKVPWHSEIGCEEFQKLHKDEREREDILLMKLANDKLWRRCPSCKIFVERSQGCKFMRCRCGTHFCYTCGSTTISLATHICYYCKG